MNDIDKPQDQRDIDAREALQTAMPDTTDCNECGHLGVNVGANCPRCGKRSAPFGPESKLRVFYGPMPESNGKSNFTAILYRDNGNDVLDIVDGITLDRSEFPDRVRYEADRARFLIGELAERPDVLAYDADKHSGYTELTASAQQDEHSGKGISIWLEDLRRAHEYLDAGKPFFTGKDCAELADLLESLARSTKAAQQDEREAESVIGVGDGSGNLFVRGPHEAILRVRSFIFDAEKWRAQQVQADAAVGTAAQPAPATGEHAAAVRTLERIGYTYHGGVLWKPPLGPAPTFDAPATSDEREAFEAWAHKRGRGHMLGCAGGHDDFYADPRVQAWWTVWQASAAHRREDQQDAERYRFLRDGGTDDCGDGPWSDAYAALGWVASADKIDSAIDAAMSREQSGGNRG